MSEKFLISVANNDIRVGVVANGLLQEVFIERSGSKSTIGNIYKGKVVRILPGLQSAFVDIGESRTAFMHISDLLDGHRVYEERSAVETPDIADLLHDDQDILVQVTKEPIDKKGARITKNMSIASRFLVFLPDRPHTGISQKIEEEEERTRLRGIVLELSKENEGFIVRTAAEGVSGDEILKDAGYLRTRWQSIQEDARTASVASLIYEDLPLPLRVMRDIITLETKSILVDDEETHEIIGRFLTDFIPEKKSCLSMSAKGEVLFDLYQLDDQIEAALERNVPLKSGGYLTIDQTEAMTTIDVNTGAFVGRKDLEETIYRMNIEASAAIPRQLRLRNLAGIIIIDFIDMVDEEHKRQVLRTLEKGLMTDRVKCNVTQISELGLVEMTRKRRHSSLLKTMCEPCDACKGRGFMKSVESVCLEIFKDLQRLSRNISGEECLIMASQAVVDQLIDEQSETIRTLAEMLNVNICYQVEPGYSQEQYDIVISMADEA